MHTVYFRFAARGSPPGARAPLLEQLLARAPAPLRVTDWRAEAFRVIAPHVESMPAAAAAAAHCRMGSVDAAWVSIATPVLLDAGMTGVTLPANGLLILAQAEAVALAEDFNRVFGGGGMRLSAGSSASLFALFDEPLRAVTADPVAALAHDIWNFLPSGADGARLRRRSSEMEMWLFDHAVNRQRVARGAAPVSGLWLWGGGAPITGLPEVSGWTAGDDPLFAAFGSRTDFPAAPGSGVMVFAEWPGGAGWAGAERAWLTPAIAALRSGRVAQLKVSVGDRCFSLSAHRSRHFWRRARPWWESFIAAGSPAIVNH